jgi:hypothetical protein
MAFGANSTPARLGQGQTADDRALFLKVFGGEILTFFTAATLMKGKTRERTIASGKSAQFPLTGTAIAEYVTPGQELLGNTFSSHEREITIDAILASHYSVPDIDAAMSHFDLRGPIAEDMGRSLARTYDRNCFRSVILAARAAAAGSFPAGNTITDAGLLGAGAINGLNWINAIRNARIAMFQKNVPENAQFYMVVNPNVFDAIKWATNAGNQYVLINQFHRGGDASVQGQESLSVEGVTIYRSNLLPNTNETADTSVFAKYRANYATTTGLLFTTDAVGTVQLLGVAVESTRDVRRLEDFMVARMAVGHGILRPECAVEFRTAAP